MRMGGEERRKKVPLSHSLSFSLSLVSSLLACASAILASGGCLWCRMRQMSGPDICIFPVDGRSKHTMKVREVLRTVRYGVSSSHCITRDFVRNLYKCFLLVRKVGRKHLLLSAHEL